MTNSRKSPIEISPVDFKEIGYQLVDAICNFMETIHEKPVTTGESPKQIQQFLGNDSLPEDGSSVSDIIAKSTGLILEHSLLNFIPGSIKINS